MTSFGLPGHLFLWLVQLAVLWLALVRIRPVAPRIGLGLGACLILSLLLELLGAACEVAVFARIVEGAGVPEIHTDDARDLAPQLIRFAGLVGAMFYAGPLGWAVSLMAGTLTLVALALGLRGGPGDDRLDDGP